MTELEYRWTGLKRKGAERLLDWIESESFDHWLDFLAASVIVWHGVWVSTGVSNYYWEVPMHEVIYWLGLTFVCGLIVGYILALPERRGEKGGS